jgi:Uma2 family endonuclease
MAVIKRDDEYHTYADYLVWSASYGHELVDGVAYIREPPAPSWSHQLMVGELYLQLAAALEGSRYRVCIAPSDIRLPKGVEADDDVDTVVQPDVFIVSNRAKVDTRGLRGAPDWLAEVLSPSTARHDQFVKTPAYERAGVREVWLIHPINQTLMIYRLKGGSYGGPTIRDLEGKTRLTAVPGAVVDWDRLLARIS